MSREVRDLLVSISEITVNSGRREATPESVKALAGSIAEVGLLNPVTIDCGHTPIAGLHQLEAAKLLGWTDCKEFDTNNEGNHPKRR